MQRSSSPRARGSLESVRKTSMQVVLETHPIEGDGEIRPGFDCTRGGCQDGARERDSIPHSATEPNVKLADKGDLDECMPGDPTGDPARPSLYTG